MNSLILPDRARICRRSKVIFPANDHLCPVMITALHDFDGIVGYAIYQAVGVINAAAPPAGKFIFQRLGFTNALMPVPFDILNEFVNALDGFLVFALPPNVVILCLGCPNQPHLVSESSCSLPHPALSSSIAFCIWLRFGSS